MTPLPAAALAALAVVVAWAPNPGAARLRRALPGRDRDMPTPGSARRRRRAARAAPGPRGDTSNQARPRGPLGPSAACGLAGVALLLVVGGLVGALLGLLLAAAGPRALRDLEPRAHREDRERLAADLPLALDLLAACLAGGATLPAGVRAVAEAVPGTCGRRLRHVAAALDLGTPPGEAWLSLTEERATDEAFHARSRGRPAARHAAAARARHQGDELAQAAARVLARAADGGAPVGAAVARLAAEARQQARARGEQAAQRAGVLSVLPLGLCFLPAFVLLGVAPVVVGLVGPLLASW